MEHVTESERWHELLTSRFVCEICLTRFFVPYRKCPACHHLGSIQPLVASLLTVAQDDADLRSMIAHGQVLSLAAATHPAQAN